MTIPFPRQTGPTLPYLEGMYIKPRAVSLCHVASLVFQKPGKDYLAALAYEGPKGRGQLAQGPGENIRDENIHTLR